MEILGVVLAGGESRRFKANKIFYKVQGKSMIARVVEALEKADVGEIAVSTRAEYLKRIKQEVKVEHYIVDHNDIPVSGPIRGVLSVAREVNADYYLIVPCDVPWIEPGVLSKLVDLTIAHNAFLTSPYWGNGLVEFLIVCASRASVLALENALASRGSLCKVSDLHRGSQVLILAGVSSLTENLHAFANVNLPRDVKRPKVHGEPTGSIVKIEHEHSNLFWKASTQLSLSKEEASRLYELEAAVYSKHGAYGLAYHALLDALELTSSSSRRSKVEEIVRAIEGKMKWRKRKC